MQSSQALRSEPCLSLPLWAPFHRSLAGLHNTPLSCVDFHTYLSNPNPPTLSQQALPETPGRYAYAPTPVCAIRRKAVPTAY